MISLTEQLIMNENFLPEHMSDMRAYRIEYGFEDSSPEGIIYLPSDINPELIEHILNKNWRALSNALGA